jgi:hypothetical protein
MTSSPNRKGAKMSWLVAAFVEQQRRETEGQRNEYEAKRRELEVKERHDSCKEHFFVSKGNSQFCCRHCGCDAITFNKAIRQKLREGGKRFFQGVNEGYYMTFPFEPHVHCWEEIVEKPGSGYIQTMVKKHYQCLVEVPDWKRKTDGKVIKSSHICKKELWV